MKIGRQLNTLSHGEYLHLLANYKKFTDFNHLGLFRSLLENNRLTAPQQIEIRDAAIQAFPKFFEFLQLKDPGTFYSLVTLGLALTVADERQLWEDIRRNQQRLLAAKGITHRNIGTYARHDCGYETCQLRGLMLRPGSRLLESPLHFRTDKNRDGTQSRAEGRRRDRKQQRLLIGQELADAPTLSFRRV